MMEMKMEMEMMLITVSFVPKSSYSSTPRAKASSLWRRNLLEREESAHQQPQPPRPLGQPDHPNYPDQLDCIVSIVNLWFRVSQARTRTRLELNSFAWFDSAMKPKILSKKR